MTFKPPYWYHDNIEFSYEDLKELKFDIDFIDSQKYAKEEQHISTYFLKETERPDKKYNKLSVTEREIGGIPNSSEDIKQAHASAIETYIEHFVGLKESGYGDVYFQRTLEDWAKFNINNRTKHDASISSGLALMACNKHRYSPVNKKIIKPVDLGIKRYDNRGTTSKIIS